MRPHDPAASGSPVPAARPRGSVAARARAELAPVRRRAAVVAAAAAAWAVWASGPGWSTPALVVAAVGGAALGVVDARTHRLPNALLFPTAAGVGVLLVLAAVAGGDLGALLRAVLGATALGLGYLLLHLLDRSGLGLGDVKLAVLLGATSAWYGWGALAGAALLPFLVGGLVAVALLVTRRANRRTALAFGPYMLLGTVLAITAARLGA
ncbi:prepilin peptidase [Isoptericola cucumis]|uniref:Prepilin type IV endopeptidase peptidase domain-containing protein n=1 Tax=Isoptericola cucumis TaxID=1776856 RepID=A0ABQ2B856_9MICO|nr:A24 family peptidase [Isoptericola cucumis]GGI10270.1 hypothetical protein GCM10007368_30410 [Isoptericola cucumis]